MLPPKSLACFDAGSEYCPCILAALGKCIACSMLQGRDTCDCGWSGICVFAEFERAGKQVKPGREQILAQVTEVTPLARPRDDYKAYLAEIAVPPNLARWCTLPGSFVLLRPESAREAFNVPISVMDTAGRGIRIAVECRGPKTTALEKALLKDGKVTVTGPFWSGLQGCTHPADLAHGNTLVVAKGMAQAAVPPIARYICARGGNLKVLAGPGTLGTVFIGGILEELGASFEIMPKAHDRNLGRISDEITSGSYGLIVSAGSKLQHQALINLLRKISEGNRPVPRFAWISHLTMVCAEGICGACLLAGFRGCKARLDESFQAHLLH
jgi:NAD(P)H-flavin reductase